MGGGGVGQIMWLGSHGEWKCGGGDRHRVNKRPGAPAVESHAKKKSVCSSEVRGNGHGWYTVRKKYTVRRNFQKNSLRVMQDKLSQEAECCKISGRLSKMELTEKFTI